MDFGKPFNPDCPSCNYVYSTVSGTISLTQFTGDSDPNVVIDVGNGLYVIYGDVIIDGGLRAAAIAAMEAGKDGFQVKPGDVIGSLVDQRTTDRDNTHVHLVVRQDQRIYNPAYFFKDPQILTKFTWGYAAGEDLYSMSSYVYGTNLNFWKDPTSVDLTRN